MPEPASHNAAPIFLVGAERSGTTMLRLMLSHHPEIEWLNEFEYAVDRMPARGEWPDLNAYLEWLETHRMFLGQRFEIDSSLDYPHLVRSFLEQKRTRSKRPIIGATVHRSFDRLLDIWPDARFIHLLRDGRDVARSAIVMGWAGNVWYGVDKWIESENLWRTLRDELDPSRYVEVRYEDLISEPEIYLSTVCEFIGVEYSPEMLSYPNDTTYSTPNASFAYRWKTKLTEPQLALLETKVGDMLEERGYERAPVTPLTPGPVRLAMLATQNRYATIAHRIRTYGFGLWFQLALSSRVGTTAWRKRTQMRINEIDRARVK